MEQFMSGPGKLLKMVQNYRETQILFSALRLNLFSHLTEYSLQEELADKLTADPNKLAAILERLVLAHLLEKEGDAYRNTSAAELFLNRSSNFYMGAYLECWEKTFEAE